jgi:hypothetical protein
MSHLLDSIAAAREISGLGTSAGFVKACIKTVPRWAISRESSFLRGETGCGAKGLFSG